MRIILITFIITFFIACTSEPHQNKEDSDIQESTTPNYPYTTQLEGNYHLSYDTRKDSSGEKQRLTLFQGDEEVRVLSETRLEAKAESLGFIEAEFSEYFLFVQKFGEERPVYFRLINKSKGDELKKGILVDHNKEEQVILYIPQSGENRNDLRLYDHKSKKEYVVDAFDETECGPYPTAAQCVGLSKVSTSELTVSYKYEWDQELFKTQR